ncbi:MAG: hypothetical protein KQJ78_11105 [Deltaproteobacteria bacterium]|nr:hypothetical protein [Deltaproteobacteria bacterium]
MQAKIKLVLSESEPAGLRRNGDGWELVAHPCYRGNQATLTAHLHHYVDDYLKVLGPDTYVRMCISRADYDHLRAGTHRGSLNHATRNAEAGLSVSRSPEYSCEYGYYVTGRRIADGSDGEPVLDIQTARPKGKLMRGGTIYKDYRRRLLARLAEMGLTWQDYAELRSGRVME